MLPPSASTPKGSTPLGEEKTIEQEKVAMGDVVSMMRSFKRIL